MGFEYSSDFYNGRDAALNSVDELIQKYFIRFGRRPYTWLAAGLSQKNSYTGLSLPPAKRSILNDLSTLKEHSGHIRRRCLSKSGAGI